MNFYVLSTWVKARFRNADETGANLVEYILLVALIALLVIAAVVVLKNAIVDKFNDSGNCLQTQQQTNCN